jgi:hypothetical protein
MRFAGARGDDLSRVFSIELPLGYPSKSIHVKLSIPRLPPRPLFAFSDHVTDEAGRTTDTVLATTTGGFAISHDLGSTWKFVKIKDKNYACHHLIHIKSIGGTELLALAVAKRWVPGMEHEVAVLVLSERGEVRAVNHIKGSPWHGCRSVDSAHGTLMYAEYPYEDPAATAANRAPSRVFRSRDRGRTWESVFERDGAQVRHFHFLQARPGKSGEWWLTSGDKPSESNIWVSRDDGDSWNELTKPFAGPVMIGGETFPRTVFRLTDLLWEEETVVWGTDDYLVHNRLAIPGARVFRSPSDKLAPSVVGRVKWQIRNIVDIGTFYLILTQGCVSNDCTTEEKMPGVYLMPKSPIEAASRVIHVFDVDVYSALRTGFTYSRASRAAKDGTFFSFRAATDAFPSGHKILQWDVKLS